MPIKSLTTAAIIGSSLFALLLTGSQRTSAGPSIRHDSPVSAEVMRLNTSGKQLLSAGSYQEARAAFRSAAIQAQHDGDPRAAAMNWSNAGFCSVTLMQSRIALDEFSKARVIAEKAGEFAPLTNTLNNLASLYMHMGQPENAIRTVQEALAIPAGKAPPGTHAKLLAQRAGAMMNLGQFDQAEPVYRQAIGELMDQNDLAGAALIWGALGNDSLRTGRLDRAEWALSEGLRLVRIHRLNASVNILSGLGKLKCRQGDKRSAEALFAGALSAPPNATPRWVIYADRGQCRLSSGDAENALADFRESRAIAARLRADIVPADQDRVALESGLSLVVQGLIDAGNRIARERGDRAVLQETFDAAEQDRLWSLRALVPSPNDWRTRLPDRYWEVLARYQALERTSVAKTSPVAEAKIGQLRAQLQQIESGAAGAGEADVSPAESPLVHVEKMLDPDTVLLSFHASKTSSWVWAVDREGVAVYPLPPMAAIQAEVSEFARSVKESAAVPGAGARIYRDLFGAIPDSYLRRTRWLLELDGPLYDLPFAALVTGMQGGARPVFLVDHAALQIIPSALLLERGSIPAGGGFLGVGDPVYNTADPRYRGRKHQSDLTLPRLPNTATELNACVRAWNARDSRLLTGREAAPGDFREAMKDRPAIIHFATHVVSAPGEFRSGLIALSLDKDGAMGLLGPKEIIARPVAASLVVMNGCHSAQGEALPSAGLMGLTRAWIGAGAKAVLATQWDIPDDDAESLTVEFYRALRASPERGAARALREAQLSELRKDPKAFGKWAGYFLLSRTI